MSAAEPICGMSIRGPTHMVVFHRAACFYPLELPVSDDLGAHAEANPGTLKITGAATGNILWMPQ